MKATGCCGDPTCDLLVTTWSPRLPSFLLGPLLLWFKAPDGVTISLINTTVNDQASPSQENNEGWAKWIRKTAGVGLQRKREYVWLELLFVLSVLDISDTRVWLIHEFNEFPVSWHLNSPAYIREPRCIFYWDECPTDMGCPTREGWKCTGSTSLPRAARQVLLLPSA